MYLKVTVSSGIIVTFSCGNVPAVGAAYAGKGAFGHSVGVWRQLACGASAIAAAALVGLQYCRVVEARNVLPRVQRDQNGARVRVDLCHSFSNVIILFTFICFFAILLDIYRLIASCHTVCKVITLVYFLHKATVYRTF